LGKVLHEQGGPYRLTSPGRFVATDAGRALLAQNPNQINIALLRQ
jgi:hypothetical protein